MTVIEALQYLFREHKAIASAYNRARLAIQHGENTMPHEDVALAIVAAEQARDNTALVPLAEQWKTFEVSGG